MVKARVVPWIALISVVSLEEPKVGGVDSD